MLNKKIYVLKSFIIYTFLNEEIKNKNNDL